MRNATATAVDVVPAATALFWSLKVLTTGMGETASDWLARTLDPVLAVDAVPPDQQHDDRGADLRTGHRGRDLTATALPVPAGADLDEQGTPSTTCAMAAAIPRWPTASPAAASAWAR